MPDKKKIKFYRPSWIEIDLSAISYNLRQVRRLTSPKIKILSLVKSDAYGHGIAEVSKQMVKDGVDYLGVASIDEAIILRKAKVDAPMLVLSPVLEKDLAVTLKFNLTLSLCDLSSAVKFNNVANKFKKQIRAHIKIDTGMGRLGFWHETAEKDIYAIGRLKNIYLEGIFTHLSSADVNREFTLQQIKGFNKLIRDLDLLNIRFDYYHAANSIGLLDFKESHFNLIRPGLIVYGLYPKFKLSQDVKLKPAMSLYSKVIFVKDVGAGRSISYGATYVTSRASRIVTIPVGYGDGYPRILSNHGPVLIKNRAFHISGRVCMDQIMVDVGATDVKIGDEVVLLGRQGKYAITAEELSELANTIPYEIVCSLGQQRLPRIFT